MVRRRVDRPETVLPGWVESFVPESWPGDSEIARRLAWRSAVRGYCRDARLRERDFERWIEVIRQTSTLRPGVPDVGDELDAQWRRVPAEGRLSLFLAREGMSEGDIDG